MLSTVALGLMLLQTQNTDALPDPIHNLQSDMRGAALEAIDKRDSADPVFSNLPIGLTHTAFGMIGTEASCASIREALPQQRPPTAGSILGLALCRNEDDGAALVDAINLRRAENDSIADLHLPLLGAHGSKEVQDWIISRIAQESVPSVALIDGVMHSFAYTRPALSDLPAWDISGQIMAIDALGTYEQQYAIRFALSRLKQDNQLPIITTWARRLLGEDTRTMAGDALDLRVFELRGFQPGHAITLQVRDHILAKGHDRLRQEVIRFYSPTGDAGLLLAIAGDELEPQGLRSAALGRFSQAKELTPETLADIEALLGDDSVWVAVTALRVLSQFEPTKARAVAAKWLDEKPCYQRMKAASLLAGDETGTSFLRGYQARKPEDPLSDLIETLLSDVKPQDNPQADTPVFADARAALGWVVTLETTKGPIKIGFKQDAPFAAYNFYTLVKEGHMNGMVFHRVIPNFVAQWGETLSNAAYTWPNVRDNWLYGGHGYGSVGVATAGKDTGSSQFFINLVHNRTLDHRYTVVGQVMEGMRLVESLVEGDVVMNATLAPVGEDQSKRQADLLKQMQQDKLAREALKNPG